MNKVIGSKLGHTPIAIVGMACRLPGGNDTPQKFWKFLKDKKSGIKEVPSERWSSELFYDSDPNGIAKSVSKWAGFLDDINAFDARFFGISPREAASMDPQQRMILQGTYEALQDTNVPVEEFSKGSTGVFVGISQSDFRSVQEMRLTSAEAFAGTGFALCINANRVSHRLNLTGPSSAIDTACSSSMVALDQAVHALINGECDVAVAAGVNALFHPSSFIAFSKAGMLSPTGKISTFDKNANGFVRGEGFGAVVLKPLDQAKADGDRVHAVIHATHVNQDGYTSTITAPNQSAQIDMLRTLVEKSGVPYEKIGYVEAHGTGTPVGDPLEAGAIGQVIGQSNPTRPVYIGSVKANIGHLESAAGIAGLIKATLAVKHGEIPPNVNFKEANPFIPMDALNLKVPQQTVDFPDADGTRYAVVNSFGFGGTNASVLISSAPEAEKPAVQTTSETLFPHFFPLSGATAEMVVENAKALLKSLGKKGALAGVPLAKISAALATKREHLSYRTVILARTEKELKSSLLKLIAGKEDLEDVIVGQAKPDQKLCFMFSGQGSQSWNMARDFILHDETFASTLKEYDTHFKAASGWSIREALLQDQDVSKIDDTTVTQPALFAIQASLAAVWKRFGVTPDMTVGHSIGETAASYVAGGISLDGAARFLNKRGAIRDQLGVKGGMAAVGLNHADVDPLLPENGKISIAAVNGPGSTTISGDDDAIVDFVDEFEMTHPDTFIRKLNVDTAWHSYHLENGQAWFRSEMSSIDWSVPSIPFISTVTGKMDSRFDVDYGWLNLRKPVLFQKGIEVAIGLGATTFVELGPHSTLLGPTTSTALENGAQVSVLSSISRKGGDFDVFARTAANLFVQGFDLDWDAISSAECGDVDLPRTVWDDTEFEKSSEESRSILNTPIKYPFLGMRANNAGTAWRSEFNLAAYPYLKDHRLQADAIFPAAGYLDTILAAATEIFGDKCFEIKDAEILEAMFIEPDQDVLMSVVYAPERGRMQVFSRVRDSSEEWTLRCEGLVFPTDAKRPKKVKFDPNAKGLQRIGLEYVYDVDGSSEVINYGDTFRVIKDLWMTNSTTSARIVLDPEADKVFGSHFAHPTTLDGCLQITDPRMTLAKIMRERQPDDPAHLPVGVRRVRYYAPLTDEFFVHSRQHKGAVDKNAEGGFVVTDVEGNVLMTMDGLMMRILHGRAKPQSDGQVSAHYVHQTISKLRDKVEISPELANGHWILLGDPNSQTRALRSKLKSRGATVSVMNSDQVADDLGEALTDRFEDALEAGQIAGVIYALSLNDRIDRQGMTDALFDQVNQSTKHLVSLGNFMDYHRSNETAIPRITVLTQQAYADAGDPDLALMGLTQAPLVAVARGLATETPEYTVRVIDTDAQNLAKPDRIADYILSDTAETEVLLRGDEDFGPRLQKVEQEDFDPKLMQIDNTDAEVNFHATMKAPGVIDDLELQEIPMEAMSADQVRVRISAVGLNFRDIMAVTGLLPEEAEPDPAWQHLGLEFGGEVVEVGANITGFKAGDRVMGLGRRCLQRFMSVDPQTLTHLPEHISLEEAATIPSAFATAHYALNRKGQMAKGERVFIHVATGGVGTAAVQLAKEVGAEIFATAGSPKKRKILKDWGVDHIMDSRSLQFADDVERITKGEGVDVLLNSLPGDYIAKGLEIMAPYGRYLEIGKRDVYGDSAIGMKALRKNVSINVMDLAAMGTERPDLLAEMFTELVDKFETRDLSPLPVTSFPISKITDAFRFMSQAKHIGKVVVSLEEASYAVRRDPSRKLQLASDASYLITGGTKGFSLSIADWMSRVGAGRLILASRSGTLSPADQKKVARMEARGTEVDCRSLDVTSGKDVLAFVKAETKAVKPLRGVIHGAAVIQDGFANQLTPEMISDVLRPKVSGGWNLHQAFERVGVNPDFLIGFSSIAQVIGSGGQTNYVAANAFLDALGHYRRQIGANGSAIDWGVISQSGFVARNKSLGSYLDSVGLQGLKTKETFDAMDTALTCDAASFTYSKADWPQVARANPALGQSPRMAGLLQAEEGGNKEVRARLLTLDDDDLIIAISDFIQDEVCNVLKIDKSVIQTDRAMSELGLDSLSSFELKMRVETMLDFTLPISKFLQAPSIDELAEVLKAEIIGLRASLLAEAERAAAGDDSAAGTADASQGDIQLADCQIGALEETMGLMTSGDARRAFENTAKVVVREPLEMSKVKAAVRKLTRRHPLLGLQIEDGADGLIASFGGAGPRLVGGKDTSRLDVEDGEYARLAVGLSAKQTELRLTLHGVIGDQSSAKIALGDLVDLLTDKPLKKAPSKAALKAFLADMTYDAEDPTSQNDRSFVWYLMGAGAKAVEFARRGRPLTPVGQGRDHGPVAHVEATFGGKDDAARLMSAFASALRVATKGQGGVLLDWKQDRRGAAPDGLVAPMKSGVAVVAPSDASATFDMARLRRLVDHIASHRRFDSFAAANHLSEHFEAWGSTPFQFEFSMGAKDNGKPHAICYDLALAIIGSGAKRRLRLSYDTDVVEPGMAEAVKDAFMKALARQAA